MSENEQPRVAVTRIATERHRQSNLAIAIDSANATYLVVHNSLDDEQGGGGR